MISEICQMQDPDKGSPREKAILRFATKLTEHPSAIKVNDSQMLRQVGLDDLAIHDLCAVVAYFAFVNRIADGLGVELESTRQE